MRPGVLRRQQARPAHVSGGGLPGVRASAAGVGGCGAVRPHGRRGGRPAEAPASRRLRPARAPRALGAAGWRVGLRALRRAPSGGGGLLASARHRRACGHRGGPPVHDGARLAALRRGCARRRGAQRGAGRGERAQPPRPHRGLRCRRRRGRRAVRRLRRGILLGAGLARALRHRRRGGCARAGERAAQRAARHVRRAGGAGRGMGRAHALCAGVRGPAAPVPAGVPFRCGRGGRRAGGGMLRAAARGVPRCPLGCGARAAAERA